MIYIIRYDNRKLYIPTESRYTKLDEIKEFIKAGEAVQVTDHKTGEDLTVYILSQVLCKTNNVNQESLRQLIMKSE